MYDDMGCLPLLPENYQKYLESLKQEYLKNSISTRSNNQEAEETIENYNRYIEEVQSELVKQEQYEIFE